MNDRAKRQRIKKLPNIGWAALLVLIIAYHFGRPTLEKWTGLSLPAINSQQQTDDSADASRTGDNNSDPNLSSSRATTPVKGDSSDQSSQAGGGSSFELEKVGRNKLMSPAGLIYGMGPRGEHRVDHVMRHARDDASRPAHGVFVGDQDEILELLDEAYRLIKDNSKRVKSTRERDRTQNIVDMQRKVGYEGGQKGRRNGNRELRKVMLILQDGNEVITAYPYR